MPSTNWNTWFSTYVRTMFGAIEYVIIDLSLVDICNYWYLYNNQFSLVREKYSIKKLYQIP